MEQLYGKGPGGPGAQAAQLSVSKQFAAAAKKANTRLSCINTRRESIYPTLLSSHLEYCIQLWLFLVLYKKYVDRMVKV